MKKKLKIKKKIEKQKFFDISKTHEQTQHEKNYSKMAEISVNLL